MKSEKRLDPGPPETIEITSLGDNFRRTVAIPSFGPIYTTATPWKENSIASTGYTYKNTWAKPAYNTTPQRKFKIQDVFFNEYGQVAEALCDTDADDLSAEYILKLVESMKAKLMYKTMTVCISHFECKMTPLVRETIVRAWKKLNMYGKKPPFIPRFDEYMNELPEKFNVEGGIIVKMVDPKDYGELYFELDAIQAKELKIINDITTPDITEKVGLADEPSPLWDPDELPF